MLIILHEILDINTRMAKMSTIHHMTFLTYQSIFTLIFQTKHEVLLQIMFITIHKINLILIIIRTILTITESTNIIIVLYDKIYQLLRVLMN